LTALPQDLSLGLGAVGRLAFTAFWIYGAGFAPVLVINFANPLGLLLILGLFLLGVLVFFGCLQGLHRQLLAARRHWLEWAGQLYARAYEPLGSGSLASLGEQAQALQAAEVIHRRAEAIQQWPFQQRRLAPDRGHRGDRGHLRPHRHHHPAHLGPLGAVDPPAAAGRGHGQARSRYAADFAGWVVPPSLALNPVPGWSWRSWRTRTCNLLFSSSAQRLSLARSSGQSASCRCTMGPSIGW
jgi:hypothetical protein